MQVNTIIDCGRQKSTEGYLCSPEALQRGRDIIRLLKSRRRENPSVGRRHSPNRMKEPAEKKNNYGSDKLVTFDDSEVQIKSHFICISYIPNAYFHVNDFSRPIADAMRRFAAKDCEHPKCKLRQRWHCRRILCVFRMRMGDRDVDGDARELASE